MRARKCGVQAKHVVHSLAKEESQSASDSLAQAVCFADDKTTLCTTIETESESETQFFRFCCFFFLHRNTLIFRINFPLKFSKRENFRFCRNFNNRENSARSSPKCGNIFFPIFRFRRSLQNVKKFRVKFPKIPRLFFSASLFRFDLSFPPKHTHFRI